MRSMITKKAKDPVDISFPHLRVCKSDPNLVVLFMDRNKGMIVSKAMYDDRPLFTLMEEWDENLFEYFDEAVIIQNN